jgi:hypothetical protein
MLSYPFVHLCFVVRQQVLQKGEVMNTCQNAPTTKTTPTKTPPLFPKINNHLTKTPHTYYLIFMVQMFLQIIPR